MGGGARDSSLYLMNMWADVVYRKHFRTHLSQIGPVKMLSQVPVPGCVLLENDIPYRDSDFTVA